MRRFLTFISLFLILQFIIGIYGLSSAQAVGVKVPLGGVYSKEGKRLNTYYTLNSPVVIKLGSSGVVAPFGAVGEIGARNFNNFKRGGAFVTSGNVHDGGVFADAECLEYMGFDKEALLDRTKTISGSEIFNKARHELFPATQKAFQEWEKNGGHNIINKWNQMSIIEKESYPKAIWQTEFVGFMEEVGAEQYLGYDVPVDGVEWLYGKEAPYVEEWYHSRGYEKPASYARDYSGAGNPVWSMTGFSWSFLRYGEVIVVDDPMFEDFWYQQDKGRYMVNMGFGNTHQMQQGVTLVMPDNHYNYTEISFQGQKGWWNHQPKLHYTDEDWVYVNSMWLYSKWKNSFDDGYRDFPEKAKEVMRDKMICVRCGLTLTFVLNGCMISRRKVGQVISCGLGILSMMVLLCVLTIILIG